MQPVKDAAGDVPGWVWILAIAAVAGGLFLVARHGEKKGVEAFKTGRGDERVQDGASRGTPYFG
ncbi:hypothetical protein [Mesorhizobium sp. M0598]|uniref:hypothetical protein n=1 Tax=unclassified Mesorhizobium TaxID=325217 RepID=UPI003334BE6B